MSEPAAGNELQQKYAQMVEMAPLLTALSGLPCSEGRLFSEEQVDGRATTMRAAYRVGKALLDELTEGDAQKARQFRDLLPLTIALSGLPVSGGRLFGEEQIEARAITVKAAYRIARSLARDCLGGS